MANILLSTGFSSADIKGCKSADGFTVLAQMHNGDSITLNLNNQEAAKLKSVLNLWDFEPKLASGPLNAKLGTSHPEKKRLR